MPSRLAPTVERRTVLVGALAALAGCGAVDWPDTTTPDDDRRPVAPGSGEYPHAIRGTNALPRAVSVELEVSRGDERLYAGTHRLPARSRAVLAGFTVAALPAERRYVTVAATTESGAAASAGVSVTGCLEDVHVSVADAGVSVTPSTCLDGSIRPP